MPEWKWYKAQLPEKNGLKVMSCFSCGGGSSYGYKLAGYDVIANCEIDDKIYEMYIKNHHPKYGYKMDIRDFLALDDSEIPDELKDLDVLDGSPPCSTFSMAGKREEGWGKEKTFREGQKKQRLDDLFFVFLDVVEKLKPKCVVAENVDGLTRGNAKGYVKEIFERFRELGYDVQLFRLNSKYMGVPQSRTRVFFCANRLGKKKLSIAQDKAPIVFGKVKSEKADEQISENTSFLLNHSTAKDRDLCDVNMRLFNKHVGYTQPIIKDNEVCHTITANGQMYRKSAGNKWGKLTNSDFISCSTFPQDYDFNGQDPQYVCGMSVPPLMMYGVAEAIKNQWLLVGDQDGKA